MRSGLQTQKLPKRFALQNFNHKFGTALETPAKELGATRRCMHVSFCDHLSEGLKEGILSRYFPNRMQIQIHRKRMNILWQRR